MGESVYVNRKKFYLSGWYPSFSYCYYTLNFRVYQ